MNETSYTSYIKHARWHRCLCSDGHRVGGKRSARRKSSRLTVWPHDHLTCQGGVLKPGGSGKRRARYHCASQTAIYKYILHNMDKYDNIQVNHSVCLARSLIHEKNLLNLPNTSSKFIYINTIYIACYIIYQFIVTVMKQFTGFNTLRLPELNILVF